MASTAAHTRVPILARRLERVGARFIARPARSVAARVKRGTWNVPDDEVPSDERVGGGGDAVALDLDAEEPEPDPNPPPPGALAPRRDDGMARMPSPTSPSSPPAGGPISFAFLGDAVWELYVRRAFFAPPARPLDYDLKCKRAVGAEAQDVVLRHLIERGFFTGTREPEPEPKLQPRPTSKPMRFADPSTSTIRRERDGSGAMGSQRELRQRPDASAREGKRWPRDIP